MHFEEVHVDDKDENPYRFVESTVPPRLLEDDVSEVGPEVGDL